jgi:hypothetical protein
VGILRIAAFGLIGFSIWAGIRVRTAPPPELPVKIIQPRQTGSPVAYPFPPRPGAPKPATPDLAARTSQVHAIVGSLASTTPEEDAGRASVTGDAVFLRALPRKRSARLGKLKAGAKVFVLEQRGNWVRVRPEPPSREGWMSTKYVSRAEVSDRRRVAGGGSTRTPAPPALDGRAASLLPPETRP